MSPDFRLTATNAAAVRDICVRLEGLPLAIELVAARVRYLSPVAIFARMNREGAARLIDSEEAREPLDLPVRHRSLQQAIGWSYDLLTPSQQALFHRLSVFSGGFSLEAAEAMLPDPRSLGDLAALVDQSLVWRLPEAAAPGQSRYRMLLTVREFGMERLAESGESDVVRQKHAEFFSVLAEFAEDGMIGPDQLGWLQRLDHDHENFRAALRWAIDSRDAALGYQLVWGLWRFWSTRGWLTEARAWFDEVLALAGRILTGVPGCGLSGGPPDRPGEWRLCDGSDPVCREPGSRPADQEPLW